MVVSKPKTQVTYQGRIFQITETSFPDGRITEGAFRSPGTRIIIHDKTADRILLTREVRLDIGEDIRLPGGKVRDSWEEWSKLKDQPNLAQEILSAGAKEVRQEVGFEAKDLKIFTKSTSGGPTVGWDLYYLVTTLWEDLGHQDLELGENITTSWTPITEAIEICLSGKMREGRSAAALLQYLHSIRKI